MRWAPGAAVVLAIGAGLATYFLLRASPVPQVPQAQRNGVLEQAKAEGVITGYRVRRFDQFGWDYRVVGAGIRFATPRGEWYCGGENVGAQCLRIRRPLVLEYRPAAAAAASAILRIAEKRMPKARIKFFEVTTLG